MCGPDEPPAAAHQTPKSLQPAPVAASGDLVVEPFPLTYDDYTFGHARIAYLRDRPPAPVVLVHHNYAGLKQFEIDQASFLARLGYVGLAVDAYKEVPEYTYRDRTRPTDLSSTAGRAKAKRHFTGAFAAMNELLMKPKYWRGLMAAYLEQAQSHAAVLRGQAAAIGYCLGGQACFEQVRAGHNLQAVVSFHGLLHSRPLVSPIDLRLRTRLTQEQFEQQVDLAPNTYAVHCKVLVENGDWDDEVPLEDITAFKKEMDAEGIDWVFHNHARTPHGFALPDSYTEAPDRRATLAMCSLFAEVWPDIPQLPVGENANGTRLGQRVLPARL